VSNAMIHGHPGVTFRVSDSGEGIPQKRLDWIFGEFNQLHPAGTRSEEGVGLGLAVARRLAHLLEGELRVDSTPGEGSSFELKLPLAHTAKGQREFAQTAILQGRATVY
jgi:signal transduction histidine kinase